MKIPIWVVLGAIAVWAQEAPVPTGARDLFVTTGKSVLVDSPVVIERVSVANGDVAEAVAVTPREVLVNGRAAGETSLIVWQQGGGRLLFDLTVQRNDARIDGVRRQLAQEVGENNVTVNLEGESVFLRGTVKDLTEADRAVAIAATIGKPVNLLKVNVPPMETQVLLKVRFADVDRSVQKQFGINLFSQGNNNIGSTTTGQYSPPAPSASTTTNGGVPAGGSAFTLANALNLFLFRPDLNIGATISALEAKNLLEILAEPNVLAVNGKRASFLAGGEFPFPMLQGGGAGLGAVTIQFREFGVRLNFTPTVTARGTLHLMVQPEVSSLDFANGLTINGYTIPALSTRRVQTEIELEDGQSFAIGGLLDNRDTETLNKIPGLSAIPLLGKLFQSRLTTKSNSELLVLVTAEIVRPMPAGQQPALSMPGSFLPTNTSNTPPQTFPTSITGPVPPRPDLLPIRVEQLVKQQQQGSQPGEQQQPVLQFMPVITPQAAPPGSTPQPIPQAAPAPPAPQPGTP